MVSFGAYVNMASAKDEYKDLQSAKIRQLGTGLVWVLSQTVFITA